MSPVGNTPTFGAVRRGYDPAAVDTFVARSNRTVQDLEAELVRLQADNDRLRAELAEARTAVAPPLNEQAGEVLRIARVQAKSLTDEARREADRLLESAGTEGKRLRTEAASALVAVTQNRQADWEEQQRRGWAELAAGSEQARREQTQLLTAARIEADALRAAAEHEVRALRDTAELEVQRLRVRAEQEAARAAAELADERERMFTELSERRREVADEIRARVAETSALQQSAAEHLQQTATEAAQVREAALAEAERIRHESLSQADAVVQRAHEDATTLEERSRQEFAWRKRQVRREQDLVNRRKQAVREHLVSLSALATETAAGLPELPDGELREPRETAVSPA